MIGSPEPQLTLDNVRLPPLWFTRAEFTRGLTLVLGAQPDGAPELVRTAAGLAPSGRADVLLGGLELRANPALRRRVGVLLPEEELPAGVATVERAIALVLELRRDDRRAADLLGEYGLLPLAPRRPNELAPGERRALALALALSVRDALACILYEPGVNVGPFDPDLLGPRLQQLAASAVVLCVTAYPQFAATLGSRALLLRHGKLHPESVELSALDAHSASLETLEAQVSGAARAAFDHAYSQAQSRLAPAATAPAIQQLQPYAPEPVAPMPLPPDGSVGVWPPPKPEGEQR
jgi:ABC-type multidrug transport system ATPase subunit